MKKLLVTLSTAVLGSGLFMGAASAATVTCGNISNTGPGSTNSITCVTKNDTNVTCDNNIVVENNNQQNGNSGGSSSTGNTSSGFTTTGDVNNNNTATVAVGASCEPQVATTTTTPPATTTPAGGAGGATTAAPAKTVANLPETGSNTALNDSIIGVAVLGGSMAASQIALRAYRRLALR